MRRRHCKSLHDEPSILVMRTLDIRFAALQYGQSVFEIRHRSGSGGRVGYMVEGRPGSELAVAGQLGKYANA